MRHPPLSFQHSTPAMNRRPSTPHLLFPCFIVVFFFFFRSTCAVSHASPTHNANTYTPSFSSSPGHSFLPAETVHVWSGETFSSELSTPTLPLRSLPFCAPLAYASHSANHLVGHALLHSRPTIWSVRFGFNVSVNNAHLCHLSVFRAQQLALLQAIRENRVFTLYVHALPVHGRLGFYRRRDVALVTEPHALRAEYNHSTAASANVYQRHGRHARVEEHHHVYVLTHMHFDIVVSTPNRNIVHVALTQNRPVRYDAGEIAFSYSVNWTCNSEHSVASHQYKQQLPIISQAPLALFFAATALFFSFAVSRSTLLTSKNYECTELTASAKPSRVNVAMFIKVAHAIAQGAGVLCTLLPFMYAALRKVLLSSNDRTPGAELHALLHAYAMSCTLAAFISTNRYLRSSATTAAVSLALPVSRNVALNLLCTTAVSFAAAFALPFAHAFFLLLLKPNISSAFATSLSGVPVPITPDAHVLLRRLIATIYVPYAAPCALLGCFLQYLYMNLRHFNNDNSANNSANTSHGSEIAGISPHRLRKAALCALPPFFAAVPYARIVLLHIASVSRTGDMWTSTRVSDTFMLIILLHTVMFLACACVTGVVECERQKDILLYAMFVAVYVLAYITALCMQLPSSFLAQNLVLPHAATAAVAAALAAMAVRNTAAEIVAAATAARRRRNE